MTLPSGGETPVVLVVDDDADLRALIALSLARADLEAVEAAGAREGLEIIGARRVDILLVDMIMPGMSGLELIRTLRANPETSTLPVILMTGSGDEDSVIQGLEVGADDFLGKPVRLEELVARLRSHLRTYSAWTKVLETEMRVRAGTVQAISRMAVSKAPEEAAELAVSELVRRTGSQFVGVLQLFPGDRLQPLARFSDRGGLVRGGPELSPARAHDLLSRSRRGSFVEQVSAPMSGEPRDPFWEADLDIAAGAPIYYGDEQLGILVIGLRLDAQAGSLAVRQTRLLASAIDYAGALSAVAGRAIADRRDADQQREELRRMLVAGAFEPVYQPVVTLGEVQAVGYEALTRFADGAPPNVRFEQARMVGLGPDFELAAVDAALDRASRLPADAWLSVNVSPELVIHVGHRLRRALSATDRRVVLEVTEHRPITDYRAFRRALSRLGDVALAIDDAGAGYASLRHILELSPTFAKLDRSLVHGIDTDPVRQALVAGLGHFAGQTGVVLIAEGIENGAEAQLLPSLGVEYGQGYLFGRPEPRDGGSG
jgi:EAL domain-containing protein (putative c-di-GMP-specific phosphodiesterase class I)/DNA-binding response OmpR family regulator